MQETAFQLSFQLHFYCDMCRLEYQETIKGRLFVLKIAFVLSVKLPIRK